MRIAGKPKKPLDISDICYNYCYMNNKWIMFSFTLSARNQAGRMRVWRRLTGLGAVIVKSALYALPARDDLREQLSWLVKEVEGMGGEALLLETGLPANMAHPELAALFTQARDSDWQALEEELLAILDKARSADVQSEELEPARRKLVRRAETVAAIDYFPSGRGARAEELLKELAGVLAGPGEDSAARAAVEIRDPEDYKGMTWITREDPYIDRLASFWLVRRFIDPDAPLAFVPTGERPAAREGTVRFDMDEAEFTHVGPLTTFEAMCEAFSLGARVPSRLREIIRAIDLNETGTGPAEAPGVKLVLDGICLNEPDGLQRARKAGSLFDALLAACNELKGETK